MTPFLWGKMGKTAESKYSAVYSTNLSAFFNFYSSGGDAIQPEQDS